MPPQDAVEAQHFTARSYDVQVSWEAGRQVTRRIARPDIFHISKEEVRWSCEARYCVQHQQVARAERKGAGHVLPRARAAHSGLELSSSAYFVNNRALLGLLCQS